MMTRLNSIAIPRFKLPRRRDLTHALRTVTLALGLLFTATPVIAESRGKLLPIQMVSATRRAELEAVLTEKLQRYASGKPYYTQLQAGPLSAKFDLQTGMVVVDLGAEFGPDADDPDAEDLRTELDEVARSVLEGLIDDKGTTFRYGGKDFYYYHPDQWQAPGTQQPHWSNAANNGASIQAATHAVVVSPGHGKYRLYNDAGDKFNWVWQRTEVNRVQEDMVTHAMGKELMSWLPVFRSGMTIAFTRSLLLEQHPSGGDRWKKYAARSPGGDLSRPSGNLA